MRVLLTGAFGNLGQVTLDELVMQGHRVRCFDLHSRANDRLARDLPHGVEVTWGDLRRPEDALAAVQGQDIVLHLAFLIPELSSTGLDMDKCPDLARDVNVGGTANLIRAMEASSNPARLLFASSMAVFGLTQDRPPPRVVADPVGPVDPYSSHKVACEEMIRSSRLEWSILRLAAALPRRLLFSSGMFDVPLDNRIEFVHHRDAALAFANALRTDQVWGQTLLIGGGERCQLYYRDMVRQVLEATGVGMLPAAAFSTAPYPTDWLDTSLSSRLLHYQRHTVEDHAAAIRSLVGLGRPMIRACRPAVHAWLLSRSPYLGRSGRRSGCERPQQTDA
jgi:nucleoside-diphosphate-sugar epimerase